MADSIDCAFRSRPKQSSWGGKVIDSLYNDLEIPGNLIGLFIFVAVAVLVVLVSLVKAAVES